VLLRQAGELAAEASGGPGALAGPLAVGCYPSLGPTTMPGLLSGFAERHPAVMVDFAEHTQEELCQRLISGELDLVITYDLELPAELQRIELHSRRPYVLLARDHPLAATALDLTALEPEPMVLLDGPAQLVPRAADLRGRRDQAGDPVPHGELRDGKGAGRARFGWTLLCRGPSWTSPTRGWVSCGSIRPARYWSRCGRCWPGPRTPP